MKELMYAPVTGRVYCGSGKPLKGRPGVSVMSGRREDVTESFYAVLAQVFPPRGKDGTGGEYGLTDADGRPLYKLTVEEAGEEGL